MMRCVAIASAACSLSAVLQGCGSSSSPTPAPTPSPAPTPVPTPAPTPSAWNLNPIEVKGHGFYDSVTGKEFFAKGIAMPNLKAVGDVDDWIKIMENLRNESNDLNVLRVYEFPDNCFDNHEKSCMDPIMRKADELGFYVIVAGTGTMWGYLPRRCKNGQEPGPGCAKTAAQCYKNGGVLGFGQTIVQNFNYPNTLAIVIGNEVDQQTPEFLPVIKAYARDLNAYMKMCNTDDKSPSKGHMRQIPLMYTSSDDRGDAADKQKTNYLFCGNKTDETIDIFGLNIERWCDDTAGRITYDAVNDWVNEGNYDGVFMFSEMGCSKTNTANGSRTWKQLEGFFETMPSVDGFVAYAYQGNPDFDMMDGPTSSAKMLKDGENFFTEIQKLGKEEERQRPKPRPTDCSIVDVMYLTHSKGMVSVDDVPIYDTGATGWAAQCPAPRKPSENMTSIIV